MSEVEKMAYYDLKTNEIWAESNIDRFHDEHIEIDEVIAPLIRELNIKGYKTKFCCSGHPFYAIVKKGYFSTVHIGGTIRISKRSFDAWLDEDSKPCQVCDDT